MVRQVLPLLKGIGIASVVGLVLYIAGQTLQAQETQGPTVGAYVAPVDVDTTALPGPVQPIFYRHDIHAGQYEIDCRFCHYAAEVSSSPGLPSTDSCMSCHLLVGSGNPEVQKLREAAAANEPIQWTEVHQMAQFVKFPHMRHVNADVTCQECHGPVQEMPQVYQFSSLKMGWCLDCHDQRSVSTDCTVCHY